MPSSSSPKYALTLDGLHDTGHVALISYRLYLAGKTSNTIDEVDFKL
jgi:hypothetical protein